MKKQIFSKINKSGIICNQLPVLFIISKVHTNLDKSCIAGTTTAARAWAQQLADEYGHRQRHQNSAGSLP